MRTRRALLAAGVAAAALALTGLSVTGASASPAVHAAAQHPARAAAHEVADALGGASCNGGLGTMVQIQDYADNYYAFMDLSSPYWVIDSGSTSYTNGWIWCLVPTGDVDGHFTWYEFQQPSSSGYSGCMTLDATSPEPNQVYHLACANAASQNWTFTDPTDCGEGGECYLIGSAYLYNRGDSDAMLDAGTSGSYYFEYPWSSGDDYFMMALVPWYS
jgi:hypothetical protein